MTLFLSCKHEVNKTQTSSELDYIKVPLNKLHSYLKNKASEEEINYIELTQLTQHSLSGYPKSLLAKILILHQRKRVAIKFGDDTPLIGSMSGCFSGCTSLVKVTAIPQSIRDVNSCFSNCTRLTQAPIIPETVTSMDQCFSGCTSLTQAPTIPQSVTSMNGCFSGCTSLSQAPVIPQSVTSMNECFLGCTSLRQAPAIPQSVTIMNGCFSGCSSLTEVSIIPQNVTSMDWCFLGCINLIKVPTIPQTVKNMCYCFENCTKLKNITLKCVYEDSCNSFYNLFKNCLALEDGGIKVPKTELEKYKTHATSMGIAPEKFAPIE